MVTPKPQTIANDVLNEIERLFGASEPPDEFTLKRLDREADKLLPIAPPDGYTAKAGVAALRGRDEDARRYIRNAVHLSPRDPAILANAAVNFRQIGDYAEALKHERRAWEIAPQDSRFALSLVNSLHTLGYLEEAEQVMLHTKEVGIEFDNAELEQVRSQLEALRSIGVSPDQVIREVEITHEVLVQNRVFPRDVAFEVMQDPDTGEHCIQYTVEFLGTVPQSIEMEGELADRLGELEDWDPFRFSVQYRPSLPAAHEHQPV